MSQRQYVDVFFGATIVWAVIVFLGIVAWHWWTGGAAMTAFMAGWLGIGLVLLTIGLIDSRTRRY